MRMIAAAINMNQIVSMDKPVYGDKDMILFDRPGSSATVIGIKLIVSFQNL